MNKIPNEERNLNKEFIGFTIVSGMMSFSYNVVMIVIPLRMADRGLSYGEIGGVMSTLAIGLLVIKLVIGHLSDRLGTKRFMLVSLLGLGVVVALLANAESMVMFAVGMVALGIFRGIFLSVNGAYMFDIADNGEYGKIYGAVEGISSLLASIGGMISGVLYHLREGKYALYICSILLFVASAWVVIGMKRGNNIQQERLPIYRILKTINKRILIFCVVVFLQSFVAGPMWNFIIPMYCYNVLLFSPAVLGILMSMDELISSPTYIIAGRVVDKVNVVKFNVIALLLTALAGVLMRGVSSTVQFMIVFLLCSISLSCTFVGIPRERVAYIRKEQKGLELAFLSLCGSLGDSLGSNVLGRIAAKHSIQQCFWIFAMVYVMLAILVIIPVKYIGRENGK